MAGIGFELRRMLRKNTLTGLLQAYAYAGVIGSGPWVFSIIGILLVGIFSASVVVPNFLGHPVSDIRHVPGGLQPDPDRVCAAGLHPLCVGPAV